MLPARPLSYQSVDTQGVITAILLKNVITELNNGFIHPWLKMCNIYGQEMACDARSLSCRIMDLNCDFHWVLLHPLDFNGYLFCIPLNYKPVKLHGPCKDKFTDRTCCGSGLKSQIACCQVLLSFGFLSALTGVSFQLNANRRFRDTVWDVWVSWS